MGFDFLDFGFPKSGTDWQSINGKPFITVSAKGRSNGLSNKINDGADFGPDTTLNASSPNQTGAPYTNTYGWQEVFNYIASQGGGSIYFKAGVYDFTNAPVQTAPVSGQPCKVYFPVISGYTGSNFTKMNGVKFIFETPYWFNNLSATQISPSNYGYGVMVYDNQLSPSSNYSEILFDSTDNSSLRSMIELETEGTLTVLVPLSYVNAINFGNISGLDADTFVVGTISPTGNSLTSYNNAHLYTGSGIILPAPGVYYPVHIRHINTFYFSYAGVIINSGGTLIDYILSQTNVIGILIGNTLSSGKIGILHTQTDNVAFQTESGSNPAKMVIDLLVVANGQYPNLTPAYTFSYVSGSPVGISIKDWDAYNDSTFLPSFNNFPASSIKINSKSLQGQSLTPTTPTVPASGTAQQNTNPYATNVYLYDGTVTEIQITKNGTAYTVFSNASGLALSGQVYKLNPSDSITITYTTAPTWEWLSD